MAGSSEAAAYSINGIEGVISVTRRQDGRVDVLWSQLGPRVPLRLTTSYGFVKTLGAGGEFWWRRLEDNALWHEKEQKDMPPDFVAFVQLVLA